MKTPVALLMASRAKHRLSQVFGAAAPLTPVATGARWCRSRGSKILQPCLDRWPLNHGNSNIKNISNKQGAVRVVEYIMVSKLWRRQPLLIWNRTLMRFRGRFESDCRIAINFCKNIFTDESASQARILSGSFWIFWLTCQCSPVRATCRPGTALSSGLKPHVGRSG